MSLKTKNHHEAPSLLLNLIEIYNVQWTLTNIKHTT